mmetsp:Transcript_14436/g.45394  ORF Transcript_14436/g.45394 Transcript_14436/m.45394 type:complete len:205 (-) Transcript_14436:63-677(-)
MPVVRTRARNTSWYVGKYDGSTNRSIESKKYEADSFRWYLRSRISHTWRIPPSCQSSLMSFATSTVHESPPAGIAAIRWARSEFSGFSISILSLSATVTMTFICVMTFPYTVYVKSSNSFFEYPPSFWIIFICLKIVDFPLSPGPRSNSFTSCCCFTWSSFSCRSISASRRFASAFPVDEQTPIKQTERKNGRRRGYRDTASKN